MKRTVSSVLAERMEERKRSTPVKVKVKHVEFTPEEMASDAPADVSDGRKFPIISRNQKEWEQFLSFKRGYVRLDPELRKIFKDDKQVNETLRRAIALFEAVEAKKKRKSA